ncbi:MAG: hypothetical protein ACTSPI_12710, partial [Candidatus Heimdallarchaeaceae archaeon]
DPWSTTWNDADSAFGALKVGFSDGRDDGCNEGKNDYTNNNRIPDVRFTNPYEPVNDIVDLGKNHGYRESYHIYYQAGFFYEGAQEYFNRELYWDLYDNAWDSYAGGYVDGFRDGYDSGYLAGEYDNSTGIYGDSYYPPEGIWDPRDEWEFGYNDGLVDGYDTGYDDGWEEGYGVDYRKHEEYLWGMESWLWDTHQDGFQDGADDYLTGSGYDNSSYTLPYSSPQNLWEEGANFIYSMSYPDSYDDGWKYAWLTDRDGNELNWLMHEGPFYYIMAPDFILNLQSGSVGVFPVDITMFTELNISLMDYEFDYGSHDYGPLSENFAPFSIYAPDSDWVELDTWDWDWDPDEDFPGVSTTITGDTFHIEFYWEDVYAEVSFELIIEYDMTTGKLTYCEFYLDAYTQTDMWFDVVVEYQSDVEFTLPDPNPSSWSYLVDAFSFDYVLPDEVPPEVTDGLDTFASEGAAAVGNNFMDVDWLSRTGLWNEFNVTSYNPNDPTETSDTATIMVPALTLNFQILPDWDLWSGFATTGDSFLSSVEWVGNTLDLLSEANPTADFYRHDLSYEVSTYHDSSNDIMYMYSALSGAFEFSVEALNDDYDWEEINGDLYFYLVIWVAYDYNTGILLGGGLQGTIDSELTIPDSPFGAQAPFYANFNFRFRIDTLSSLQGITDILSFEGVPEKDDIAPVITDVTYSPEKPTDEDVIVITANITDESGIETVLLHYRNNSGAWVEVEMATNGSGLYTAEIGPFEGGTIVDFYITATDYTYNANEAISDNGGAYYTFEVKSKGVLGIGFSFVDVMIMGLGLLSVASLLTLYRKRN